MRELTKQQKKVLDNYKYINHYEDLPYKVIIELERLNNTEILYNTVTAYLKKNYDIN